MKKNMVFLIVGTVLMGFASPGVGEAAGESYEIASTLPVDGPSGSRTSGMTIKSVECNGRAWTIIPGEEIIIRGGALGEVADVKLHTSCFSERAEILAQDASSITVLFSGMDGDYFREAISDEELEYDLWLTVQDWVQPDETVRVAFEYPDYAERIEMPLPEESASRMSLRASLDLTAPEAVIVTRERNVDFYERLARIHTLTGLKTDVRTTSEIERLAGRRIVGEVQLAQLIKQHLMNLHDQTDGAFARVMLGGHADYADGGIPSFQVYDTLSDPIYRSFLSDFYYANFSTWDSNGNGVHNDDLHDDPIDGVPSLGVCRVPIPAEAGDYRAFDWRFQEKTIRYLCDYDQANIPRVLFLADVAREIFWGIADINSSTWLNLYTQNRVPDAWSIDKLYVNAGRNADELTVESFHQAMEQGGYNLAVQMGHGDYNRLCTVADGKITNDDAYDLYNPGHSPIFISCACLAGSIGHYEDAAGAMLTTAPFGGAMAYIGSSSMALGPLGSSQFVDAIVEQIAEGEAVGENPILADVFRDALADFDSGHCLVTKKRADWTRKNSVLHGNGLIPVRTTSLKEKPNVKVFLARYETADGHRAQINVAVSPHYKDGRVTLHVDGDGYYQQVLGSSGACTFTIASIPRRFSVGYHSASCLPAYREYYATGDDYAPPAFKPVKAVAAGLYCTLALAEDGTVWAWGRLYHDYTVSSYPAPIEIKGRTSAAIADFSSGGRTKPSEEREWGNIVQLAAGYEHCLALNDSGSVWAWGDNTYGQLGDGGYVTGYSPAPIPGLERIVALAAGNLHTLALDEDGVVWAWGRNEYGQLAQSFDILSCATPQRVEGLPVIVDVFAAGSSSWALAADGTLWAWGYNGNQMLGVGSSSSFLSSPRAGAAGVSRVAGGAYHALFMHDDCSVRGAGWNKSNQLGDNSTPEIWAGGPYEIALPFRADSISCGSHFSMAIDAVGAVWAWGSDSRGQLGRGYDNPSTDWAAPVIGLPDQVVEMAGGGYHAVALCADGSVWCWGWNVYGQLGSDKVSCGSGSYSSVPVPVFGQPPPSDPDYVVRGVWDWNRTAPTNAVATNLPREVITQMTAPLDKDWGVEYTPEPLPDSYWKYDPIGNP